ncbi:hypothetical protein BH09SUM1_BH09SUM1_30910 [soil metagenome]
MNELTVIVPVYNDRGSILSTFEALLAVQEKSGLRFDILFINDGSRDNPQEIFEQHNIPHINQPVNMGYGAAIKTGVASIATPWFCIVDCDQSYPIDRIPDLFPLGKEYDMVVGQRDVRKNPPLHVFAKVVVCYLLTTLFGQPVRDINSGMRVFRTDVFRVFLPGLRDRFSLTSSITYGFLLKKLPIRYEPIEYFKREGQSHVRRWSFTKEFLLSMTGMWRYCTGKKFPEDAIASRPRIAEPRSFFPEWLVQALVFILGMAIAAASTWKQLTNQYVVSDDTAQHTYWMATYHNSGLFPDDMFVQYARSLSTPGLQAIYWCATLFTDPIFFGKLLCVFLFGVATWFFYKIGREYGGRISGILTAYFYAGFPHHIDRFEGGLHRAFMFPLLAAFTWALVANRMQWVFWILAAGVLIYPPAAVICVVVLPIVMLIQWRDRLAGLHRTWTARVGIVALALSIAITGQQQAANKPDFLGPKVTGDEMWTMREYLPKVFNPEWGSEIGPKRMRVFGVFYDGGRSPYLPLATLEKQIENYLFRKRTPITLWLFPAPLLLILLTLRGRRLDIPLMPLLGIFIASMILYQAAVALLFKLYIPDRYVEYTFVILHVILVSMGAAAVVMLIRPTRWKVVAIIVIMVVSARLEIFIHKYLRDSTMAYLTKTKLDGGDQAAIYDFLKAQPKDIIVAADPNFSDNITVFAQRKVLAKYELAHPWFKNYHRIVEERFHDYYTTIYTKDPQALIAFRDKYKADYLVWSTDMISPGRYYSAPFAYEPFSTHVKNEIKFQAGGDYLLPKIWRDLVVSEGGGLVVLSLHDDKLKPALEKLKR